MKATRPTAVHITSRMRALPSGHVRVLVSRRDGEGRPRDVDEARATLTGEVVDLGCDARFYIFGRRVP